MCEKGDFSIIVITYVIKNLSHINKKNTNTYEIIRFHVDLVEIAPGPRITWQTPDEQRSVVHRAVRHPVVWPGSRDRDHTDHYRQPPHFAIPEIPKAYRRDLVAIWSSRGVLQVDRRIKRVWWQDPTASPRSARCVFLLPLSPCCTTSSFSTRSPRDLAAHKIHPLLTITISEPYWSRCCLRDHRSSKTALLAEEKRRRRSSSSGSSSSNSRGRTKTISSIPRGVYLCVASSASHDEDKAGCTWVPSSRGTVAPGGTDRGRAIPI